MIFIYLLTTLIAGAWILDCLFSKRLIMRKSFMALPILLFLASQVVSTVTSMDLHTSIWGYYSRSNGGLLSIICYSLLFLVFTAYFTAQDLAGFLKATLFGGLIVALYAIPEHYGVSPSCVLLHHQWTASCWIQDVQARVFATLGQPNWLAAYLAMVIFIGLYLFLTAKDLLVRAIYLVILIGLNMAFSFTYSQSATLGLFAGLGVCFLSLIKSPQLSRKLMLLGLTVIVIINLSLGSGFKRLNLAQYLSQLNRTQTTNQPTANIPQPSVTPGVTQLEAGGTDSGKIRLIVWKGAWETFKHFPLFGTGVETFAYSYYLFRPTEHNLVSEWDFLYNKAHNEYLNYLSTTGMFGFGTYLLMIGVFIGWSVWFIAYRVSLSGKNNNEQRPTTNDQLLITCLLAAYISYLVQNFFGFSVVMIATLFYLFPAFGIVGAGQNTEGKVHFSLITLKDFFSNRAINLFSILVTAGTIAWLVFGIGTVWYADTLFALGMNYSESGVPTRAYKYLSQAQTLRPDEPYYKAELGFAAASTASLASDQDASLSGELVKVADQETKLALQASPANTSFYRTAIRTYYQLSALDDKYQKTTLQMLDKTIQLAPTDAKVYYNKGLILGQFGQTDEGLKALQKAIELKSNYREAYLTLGEFYQQLGQKDQAKEAYTTVFKLVPNDPEALDKMKELEK